MDHLPLPTPEFYSHMGHALNRKQAVPEQVLCGSPCLTGNITIILGNITMTLLNKNLLTETMTARNKTKAGGEQILSPTARTVAQLERLDLKKKKKKNA